MWILYFNNRDGRDLLQIQSAIILPRKRIVIRFKNQSLRVRIRSTENLPFMFALQRMPPGRKGLPNRLQVWSRQNENLVFDLLGHTGTVFLDKLTPRVEHLLHFSLTVVDIHT